LLDRIRTTPPAAPKVVDCHATGVCVQSGLRAEKPAPVPLTDEEIDAIRFSIPTKAVTQRDFELARAIEAKLKQKNAAAQPTPVREPEYWNVIDPAGNIVASETDAIRGWARIAGSYKPTVEGLLGFHDQGWRVLPKVTPPAAQPAVPDAMTSADIQEHIEYVAGWNDCRAEMLKGMKP
jgi:hypothetical protein